MSLGASFLMSLVATHADPCGATVKTFAVGVSANPVVRQLHITRPATAATAHIPGLP